MTWLTITNLHFNINLETKWLHGKQVSHPQNHRQATTNIAMELLPLGNVVTCCVIAGVNLNDTGAETIVTVRPSSKMLGQIPNLTPLNTILDAKTSNTSSSFPSRHANRFLQKHTNFPTQSCDPQGTSLCSLHVRLHCFSPVPTALT